MIPASIDFNFSTNTDSSFDANAREMQLLELTPMEIMLIGGGETLSNNV